MLVRPPVPSCPFISPNIHTVDIEGPNALNKHYSLLVAIMRVICAALLSRGTQNQQSLDQGRRFLAENKLSIMAVLKKSGGLAPGVQVTEQIDELADSFMLLVTFTGYLEVSRINPGPQYSY